jgi:hypothetical protein
MIEIWKPIEKLSGYFEISNTGRLRSINRSIEYSDGRIYNYIGKEYYPAYNRGYCIQCLNLNGKQYQVKFHRLVAEAFIPNPLNLPEINHKDGNKENNNDWNLEWSTRGNNLLHAYKNKLKIPVKGEKCGVHKLTEIQVNEIRKSSESGKKLCIKYNVSDQTIYDVRNRKTWL